MTEKVMTEKNFFQEIKKYATEITKEEDITKSFPYFCLKIFFPNMTDESIEEALDGLGSNDESIDAFWLDNEDQIINIVQFKASTSIQKVKENKAKREWFSYLMNVDRKLSNENLVKNFKNKRIKDDIFYKFKQAKHSNFKIKYYLFHLGFCEETILKQYPNVSYYSYEDIKEQYKEFQSMTSYENPKECDLLLTFPDSDTKFLKYQATYNSKPKDTYVVILTGKDLIKLRKEHRYQLFNRNVRYFLGKNNIVNKEIIKTAKDNPEIFYCFNNGITITCSQCQAKSKNKLKLIYPQIINGAQTVNSLYEAYIEMVQKAQKGATPKDKQDAEMRVNAHFTQIKILCRIVTSTKGDDTNFATNLTKYTNSQNDVKVFDFCANRPEQIEIQKKMSNLGYFYERKRGERAYLKNSKEYHDDLNKKYKDFKYIDDIKMSIQTVAGIYQAYLGKPSYAEADYKRILHNPDENDDYKNVFGTAKTDITDEKIKNMLLAIYIDKIFEECKKEYKKACKVWSEYVNNPNNNELKKEFENQMSNISFLSNGDKERINELLEENNISDVNKNFVEKYELINRGNYMFTGLIKYIMDKNKYTNEIINNDLYNNQNILQKNITKWISKLQKKVVKPVFDKIKETEGISLESFYKRIGTFDRLKDKINELRQDDDWDLKENFKFQTFE